MECDDHEPTIDDEDGKVEEEEECWLLSLLPPELLDAICALVLRDSPRYLSSWCLTCSTFNAVCSGEHRDRALCLTAFPALFDAGVSPVFCDNLIADDHQDDQAGGIKIPWRVRAQLLRERRMPRHLVGKTIRLAQAHKGVNRDGRIHVNYIGNEQSLIANAPFVSTNAEALMSLQDADREEVEGRECCPVGRLLKEVALFRGVDYFEMTVLRKISRKIIAIGIRRSDNRDGAFVGMAQDSIALYSNFCIQAGPSDLLRTGRQFSEGDVVGCGIDWETNEVFFVIISRAFTVGAPDPQVGTTLPDSSTRVDIMKRKLERRPWYPAAGTTGAGDKVMINFGQEPFWFDLKTFIEKKRAGQLDHLRPKITVVTHAVVTFSVDTPLVQ